MFKVFTVHLNIISLSLAEWFVPLNSILFYFHLLQFFGRTKHMMPSHSDSCLKDGLTSFSFYRIESSHRSELGAGIMIISVVYCHRGHLYHNVSYLNTPALLSSSTRENCVAVSCKCLVTWVLACG